MKYFLNNKIVDFGFELDSRYDVGTTYQDSLQGKYVPLSEAQEAFYIEHPNASVKEVFEMQISEPIAPPVLDELEAAKQAKYAEIDAQDKFSEKFFVSFKQGGVEVRNVGLWLDKSTRSSLTVELIPLAVSKGEKTIGLWCTTIPPERLDIPLDWLNNNFDLLKQYAKDTFDIMQENRNKVYYAETLEEIAQIDPKANYPAILTFELNLDIP